MSRVAAVKARPGGVDPSRMCGTYYPSDRAPALQLPSLEAARPGESVPARPEGRWLWINLWATWCGPCLREMPLIASWQSQLNREGVSLEVWYVSVDEDREDLVRFLRRNPKVAAGTSLRVTSLAALEPWLRPYGLEANQAPIHLIADPSGRLRCAHVGELRESDYPLMRELLR
ncbi:MAG: TlpA disulfide reductase family protein [Candidatus Latescibacterota bacterium]